MVNLEGLRLTNQKLTFLSEDVFRDLEKLTSMDFDENQIEMLPENIFSTLLNLKTVGFNGNKMIHLDKDLFIKNQMLEEVHFNRNILMRIDVDFTQLPKIGEINLLGNICIDSFIKSSEIKAVQEFQSIVQRNCTKKS